MVAAVFCQTRISLVLCYEKFLNPNASEFIFTMAKYEQKVSQQKSLAQNRTRG